jgi:ferredoxin
MAGGFIEREFDRDCQKRLVQRFDADQPFSRRLHVFMRAFGPVRYYPDFPRPLVKMDVAGRFHASGLEGARDVKVVFRDSAPPELPELVYKALHLSFHCDDCGACEPACPEKAIALDGGFSIDPQACTGCLRCLEVCPIVPPSLDAVTVNPEDD